MPTNPFKENMICDLGTIKAQSQLPISMSTPITYESQTAANTKPTRPRRRSRSKVVTGPPKSLCLPRLYSLENIASVLIILDGARYLALSSLAHQSLAYNDILLGIDGIIKIACLDLYIDCTPDQSEAAYIAALPLITMRLIQKCDKDEGVVGVNDLERWLIDSAAVGFLSATETAGTIKSLRNQPLLAAKHRPSDDLVVLARAALLSSSVNCIYNSEFKNY
ncbi:hypothetical protein N7449_005094 [Penicillium cf. viridicatum]|uniref:Uncharacterized protein n=1 Tax=Penicillium cf. viridicatum TaxID=2972119 RepID=A0A9W9SZ00_9EURO|nr:hypothetical protein N7449_005094 [Penicillium cf. viridicatum]